MVVLAVHVGLYDKCLCLTHVSHCAVYVGSVRAMLFATAIRDPDEAWERHIEDSLALLPAIDVYLSSRQAAAAVPQSSSSRSNSSSNSRRTRHGPAATTAAAQPEQHTDNQHAREQQQQQQFSVIDIGTGAGLPGMVFAVARPHWKVGFSTCNLSCHGVCANWIEDLERDGSTVEPTIL